MKVSAARASLFLASSCLALLCLEGVLRLTPYRLLAAPRLGVPRFYHCQDSAAGHDIRAGVAASEAFVRLDAVRYTIWSNELGCFDAAFNGEKDYVLLVGDSFTFGYAPFEDKWGTVLEQILGIRVLKCGVDGYGTRTELIKANKIRSLVKHDPRLIVVGYCPNDFEDDYLFPRYTVAEGFLIQTRGLVPETGKINRIVDDPETAVRLYERYGTTIAPAYPALQRIKYYLESHSVLYQIVRSAVKSASSAEAHRASWAFYSEEEYPWLAGAWKIHFDNIRAFKKMADDAGAELCIVLIPLKEQLRAGILEKMGLETDAPQKRIKEFCRSNGIHCFDLLPVFRAYDDWRAPAGRIGMSLYWEHDRHLNVRGNRLTGLLVARYILDNELIAYEGSPEAKSRASAFQDKFK